MSSLSTLNLQILTAPGGTLLLDATPYLTALSFETGSHGFASLRAAARLPEAVAWNVYRRGQPLHAVVCDGPKSAWEGRIEDCGIKQDARGNALTLTGFGYWNALQDLPYTALWSDSAYGRWSVPTIENVPDSYKDRFVIDTDGRIFISPKKNSTQGGPPVVGCAVYDAPANGLRSLSAITFTYAMNSASNWQMGVQTLDSSGSATSTPWSLNGNGALQTGTANVSVSATSRIRCYHYCTGASTTNTAEDGAVYARWTNVRVKTTSSSSVTTDAIAGDLVATIVATNRTQLSSSTALLSSTGVDLTDVVYEDQTPAAILTQLATAARWETGVYDNQMLYFRAKGSASTRWLVDSDGLELERSLTSLYNATYATYRDAGNRTQRTATSTDTTSVTQTGITRTTSVQADTTSSAQATAIRDASLADTKAPIPRAALVIRHIYTSDGAVAPRWMVRTGDTITIRNLPITLGTDVDRIRTFRVARTTYDAVARTLSVEPEAPLPTLPILVAGG